MNRDLNVSQPSNYYSTNSFFDDDDPTEERVDDYRQVKERLLRDQDKGLDTLGEIISRQKSMAQGISSEIDLHNEIIDGIGIAIESNNQSLIRNTRNISVITRKSDTCCYWLIIFLLLVGIIVVVSV